MVEPTEVFTVSLESSAAVTLDQPASVYIADNDSKYKWKLEDVTKILLYLYHMGFCGHAFDKSTQ